MLSVNTVTPGRYNFHQGRGTLGQFLKVFFRDQVLVGKIPADTRAGYAVVQVLAQILLVDARGCNQLDMAQRRTNIVEIG